METLKIDIQNEQEKKVILAFLYSLHQLYRTESDDYILNDAEIKEMLQRNDDYISGKVIAK